MPPAKVRIQAAELRSLVAAIFNARGCSVADAETVAETLVWANLRGIDSHGVSRVPRYLELFDKGESDPAAEVAVQHPRSAIVRLDAKTAAGPVAMTRAAHEVVAAARETGIAWAAVRSTVHTGAIGRYTSLIAEAGMAGIGIVAGVPNMAYVGGRTAGVATSPLSVAIPSGGADPVLLDMATAVVALGRLAQMKASGTPLADGVALTATGEPTNDPALAMIPLPVGGAKGAGLSLVFELLASGLVGNPIVSAFHDGTEGGRRHRQNGALIALDIDAFMPLAEFTQIVDATLGAIRALPRADADVAILVPGDRGSRTAVERSAGGVPLGPKLWEQLSSAAEALGIPVPAPLG